jgi:hypothetical protein
MNQGQLHAHSSKQPRPLFVSGAYITQPVSLSQWRQFTASACLLDDEAQEYIFTNLLWASIGILIIGLGTNSFLYGNLMFLFIRSLVCHSQTSLEIASRLRYTRATRRLNTHIYSHVYLFANIYFPVVVNLTPDASISPPDSVSFCYTYNRIRCTQQSEMLKYCVRASCFINCALDIITESCKSNYFVTRLFEHNLGHAFKYTITWMEWL